MCFWGVVDAILHLGDRNAQPLPKRGVNKCFQAKWLQFKLAIISKRHAGYPRNLIKYKRSNSLLG